MDDDSAEQCIVSAQRYREPGANAPQIHPLSNSRIVAVSRDIPRINDVDDAQCFCEMN
jgi:hypothetical protein